MGRFTYPPKQQYSMRASSSFTCHYGRCEGGIVQDELAQLLAKPLVHLEWLQLAIWHSMVVRDMKAAEARAELAAEFKDRLERNLKSHASMTHK